jgi:pimeloyl-ACP methyl ester carboxylesterase
MYGETWGEGPPVVLVLHGWRRTHADFAASMGPAAPGGALRTLAPDLPGFGATPDPPVPWGSDQYAAAVAELLRSGDGPGPGAGVVVVGHSLGGRIAVKLAAAHPELVAALVLTGAPLVRNGRPRTPPAAFRVARALHRAGLVSDDRMERERRRRGSADYRAAEGVMREVLVRLVNEDYGEALAALRCPVELVWGADDTEAPLSVAHAIAAAVPHAALTVCAAAGHLTPLTAPDELRAATERALAHRP